MSKEASSVEDTEARSAMKLALEALSLYETSHDGMVNDAMKALRQAIAEAEDNYQGSDAAKAAHMMDLYTALGVRWGEDPFAVIAKMRSIAEAEKQEPVRGVYWKCVLCGFAHIEDECPECGHHTRAEFDFPQPQQRPSRSDMTWVGLTNEEWDEMWIICGRPYLADWYNAAEAIEAILQEKNT